MKSPFMLSDRVIPKGSLAVDLTEQSHKIAVPGEYARHELNARFGGKRFARDSYIWVESGFRKITIGARLPILTGGWTHGRIIVKTRLYGPDVRFEFGWNYYLNSKGELWRDPSYQVLFGAVTHAVGINMIQGTPVNFVLSLLAQQIGFHRGEIKLSVPVALVPVQMFGIRGKDVRYVAYSDEIGAEFDYLDSRVERI